MDDSTEVRAVTYAGKEIPISAGRLTFVRQEGMWSLRVITKEPWIAASLGQVAPMTATARNGQVVDLGSGHCLFAMENSRYHFAGRDPAAPEPTVD